jgi:hypothetical protein
MSVLKIKRRRGSQVKFQYPVHGYMNVLRTVAGEQIDHGTGPNGPYVTVQEQNGQIRSCSDKKIVLR